MTLKYYRKNVYGSDLLYLTDKAKANSWFCISQKKTITERDMHALAVFGLKFVEVMAPRKFEVGR